MLKSALAKKGRYLVCLYITSNEINRLFLPKRMYIYIYIIQITSAQSVVIPLIYVTSPGATGHRRQERPDHTFTRVYIYRRTTAIVGDTTAAIVDDTRGDSGVVAERLAVVHAVDAALLVVEAGDTAAARAAALAAAGSAAHGAAVVDSLDSFQPVSAGLWCMMMRMVTMGELDLLIKTG